MNISDFEIEMNKLGREQVPFLFLIDFEMEKPLLYKLDELDPEKILYEVNGVRNYGGDHHTNDSTILDKHPEPWTSYRKKFEHVFKRLEYGDSFLTNLTIKTEVTINRS